MDMGLENHTIEAHESLLHMTMNHDSMLLRNIGVTMKYPAIKAHESPLHKTMQLRNIDDTA
jgi:hypothetical protein